MNARPTRVKKSGVLARLTSVIIDRRAATAFDEEYNVRSSPSFFPRDILALVVCTFTFFTLALLLRDRTSFVARACTNRFAHTSSSDRATTCRKNRMHKRGLTRFSSDFLNPLFRATCEREAPRYARSIHRSNDRFGSVVL